VGGRVWLVQDLPLQDPNLLNLVDEVSTKEVRPSRGGEGLVVAVMMMWGHNVRLGAGPNSDEGHFAARSDYVPTRPQAIVTRLLPGVPLLPSPPLQVKIFGAGNPIKVLAVDCGIKYNIIRQLVKRGAEVKLVPWNHPLSQETDYHGCVTDAAGGNGVAVSPLWQWSGVTTSLSVRISLPRRRTTHDISHAR
jgi:hypothetical protein